MAKKQIQIGLVYSAKVGGTFLPVRIDKSLGHGRYEGVVMPSGATVKFSTDSVKGDGETVEQWHARRKPKERALPTPVAAAKAEKPKKVAKAKEKKERKPSGLDAAAQVLDEAGEPLNAKEIVDRMLKRKLWQTGGETPHATIYAAMIREIAVKGGESRFRKVERGKFALAK